MLLRHALAVEKGAESLGVVFAPRPGSDLGVTAEAVLATLSCLVRAKGRRHGKRKRWLFFLGGALPSAPPRLEACEAGALVRGLVLHRIGQDARGPQGASPPTGPRGIGSTVQAIGAYYGILADAVKGLAKQAQVEFEASGNTFRPGFLAAR